MKTKKSPTKAVEDAYIKTLEVNGKVFYGEGRLPVGFTHRGQVDPKTGKKTVTRVRFN